MSNKIRQSSSELNPFAYSGEISSESVSKQLEQFEIKLLKAQTELNKNNSPELQLYFDRTQKMLNFARDNFEKGFLNVSNSCLKLAENYLDRCH